MARTCRICKHPDRHVIDRGIVEGRVWAQLAREHHLHPRSIAWHARHHLGPSLQKAAGKCAAQEVMSYVEQLQQTRQRILALIAEAEATDDIRTRMYLLDRLMKQAALEARLIGDIPPEVDIATHPRWLAVRTVLYETLDRFPEARRAVAEALKGVDA